MDNNLRTSGSTTERLNRTSTGWLTDKINIMAYDIEVGTKSTRKAPTRRQVKRAAHQTADKARYYSEAGTSRAGRKVTSRKAAHRRAFRRGLFG